MPEPILEQKTQPENISSYIFESILLQSERLSRSIELNRVVTDLDIYETLDRPYLTGKLVFVDNSDLLAGADIQGSEKIVISIKSLETGSVTITKTFFIDEILFVERGGDHSEVIGLHLVEDICYISNLFNISRFYDDTTFNIIKKISSEYLGREVVSNTSPSQSVSVIIPNKDPLAAMEWLCQSLTTSDGYPYYLFSSLFSNKIGLYDLESLITQESVNSGLPFHNTQTAIHSNSGNVSGRVIKSFRFEKSDNMFRLINEGVIGAEYEFLDTLTNDKNNIEFDVVEDVVRNMIGILPSKQKSPTISNRHTHSGKSFNQYKSVKTTVVGGSDAFRTATQHKLSYNESRSTAEYKGGVKSYAIQSLLHKTPVTVGIDGLLFLKGGSHTTIGNNISLQFLNTIADAPVDTNRIDNKRSGDYLIYATKHMFKKEKYDLQLTGVKLANMENK